MADVTPPPVKETALLLGARKSMVGVLTVAAPGQALDGAPAVLLLNAGIIHRVGPNRLHVDLARRLAAQGHTVLRFDLSGIGDSEPREDHLAPLEAALADIGEAIDWLESSRQFRKVVLVGLCSGADQALIHASRDPRVVGIGLLDPSIPRTSGYFVRHWSRRAMSARVWTNMLLGRYVLWQRLGQWLRPATAVPNAAAHALSLESPEVRKALEDAYRNVLGHGAQVLAVFAGTAGREYRLNYREQMLDAFPTVNFGSQLQIEYFKGSDHTFSASSDRNKMMDLVCDWIGKVSQPKGNLQSIVASLFMVSAALVLSDL